MLANFRIEETEDPELIRINGEFVTIKDFVVRTAVLCLPQFLETLSSIGFTNDLDPASMRQAALAALIKYEALIVAKSI